LSDIKTIFVDKIGVHEENHRLTASHRQTLSHKVISSTPRHERDSHS